LVTHLPNPPLNSDPACIAFRSLSTSRFLGFVQRLGAGVAGELHSLGSFMKPILDESLFHHWIPEEAKLVGGRFDLVLSESTTIGDRRFLVTCEGVSLLHVLDECAWDLCPPETREKAIVALHSESHLFEWARKQSKITERSLVPLSHYSVLTAENIYHFITSSIPRVIQL